MEFNSYENKSIILKRNYLVSLNLDYQTIKKNIKEKNEVKLFYYN